MDKKRLEEIRARERAATTGPWIVKDDNEDAEYSPFWVVDNEPDESGEWFVELRAGDLQTADFIAHSRQDIPDLLDYVAELEARLERSIELPCNIGDTVYWIGRFKASVYSGKVIGIKITSFDFDLEISQCEANCLTIKREFEKCFLAREEAERALKEGEGE